jgi:flagellar assembly factor FliW
MPKEYAPMQIVSPQFGPLDVDESTVITFPDGVPGFEDCTRYKLLHEDVPNPKVLWMQSLDDTALVFSVVDATLLGLNYQLTLTDEEAAKIGASSPEDIVLLLTLAKDRLGGKVKPNTFSPIVLNTATRKAIQKGGVRAEIVFTNA